MAFLTNMTHKCKSTSTTPGAIQVQNWQKTIGTEEKWDVISLLEKGEWIFDICCNVQLAYNSIRTIHDNDERTTHIAKLGPKVFV